MISIDSITEELGLFSDVGSDPPRHHETKNAHSIQITRNGKKTKITIEKKTGLCKEAYSRNERNHSNYRALLASENFANLRSWSGTQYQVLRNEVNDKESISVTGPLVSEHDSITAGYEEIEEFLSLDFKPEEKVRVLLVDGPAGVGKTHLIQRLSLHRARSSNRTHLPLILHVKSRGRVLSYLQDLIAFSLQTIRAPVTYDQLPILVRHGLVQLAIDGFDELGDPNGYENAWAQLREIVEDIEGKGTLILAGRETFIGRERLLSAIPRLKNPASNIAVLSLQPVEPLKAKKWLMRKGWEEDQIRQAEKWQLFDPGSYALRPFFLSKLSEIGRAESEKFFHEQPLSLLIDLMIEREANKFGDIVESKFNFDERKHFVFNILSEIARDIAENQTESIDEEALIWIVDLVLGDGCDPEISRILKNRILVIAFLTNDDRKGHRRFAHSEFYNFFLAHSAIKAIKGREVPKFIRRNIFSGDFLVSFGKVLETLGSVEDFIYSSKDIIESSLSLDRASRNIGALIISSLTSASNLENFSLSSFDVDEAVIIGKSEPATLKNISINQLDLRGADIDSLKFDSVTIGTIIVDETTRLPKSFPDVGWIQYITIENEEKTLFEEEATAWIDRHGRRDFKNDDDKIITSRIRKEPIYSLLLRLCRIMMHHHWIRSIGDDNASQLIQDPLWLVLKALLEKNDLLVENDSKPVGGKASVFYHIKHAKDILTETEERPEVRNLLKDIVKTVNPPKTRN